MSLRNYTSIFGIETKLLIFVLMSFVGGRLCDIYFEASFPILGILFPIIMLLIVYQVKKDFNTSSDE